MKTGLLLKKLKEFNVTIRLENDQLKLCGHVFALPDGLVEQVRAQKSELITYLQESTGRLIPDKIMPVPFDSSYPVSNGQKSIWTLSQFKGGSAAYQISVSLLWHGPMDRTKL